MKTNTISVISGRIRSVFIPTHKQLWRLSGVAAGKLEALSEAARPYAEGVGDANAPTARGAMS
jgi:hypothetical protein